MGYHANTMEFSFTAATENREAPVTDSTRIKHARWKIKLKSTILRGEKRKNPVSPQEFIIPALRKLR